MGVGAGRRGGRPEGGRGTWSGLVEGEGRVHAPHPHPGKCSPRESRNHWFAGTEGCSSGMGTQASWCRDKWLSTQPPLPRLPPQAPHPMSWGSPVLPLPGSGLAALPSPLTWGWGRGSKPLPSPSSPLPKGKSSPSPSCQCPSAMSGQRQHAGDELPVGPGWGLE